MAYDDRFSDRNRARGRWRDDEPARRDWRERETLWQGDEAFGGGWGNQVARPRPDFDRGAFADDRDGSGIGSGGPGWNQDRGRDPRYEIGGGGSGFNSIARGGYGFGGDSAARSPGRFFDPNYSEWRAREIAELDRDYEEYRREHQVKFDREFGAWRETRGRQREALGRVKEHMEVLGSDGQHVGTVDKIRGDSIVLTKSDQDSGGVHHAIPCGWIEEVGDKVILNLGAEDAKERWRTEGRSRALFEREDAGSRGPHMLNRAFSGTYPEER